MKKFKTFITSLLLMLSLTACSQQRQESPAVYNSNKFLYFEGGKAEPLEYDKGTIISFIVRKDSFLVRIQQQEYPSMGSYLLITSMHSRFKDSTTNLTVVTYYATELRVNKPCIVTVLRDDFFNISRVGIGDTGSFMVFIVDKPKGNYL